MATRRRAQAGAEIVAATHGTGATKQTSSAAEAENTDPQGGEHSRPPAALAGPENERFVNSALQRMLLERYGRVETGRIGIEKKRTSSTADAQRGHPGVQAQVSNIYGGALQRDATIGAWISSLEDYPRANANVHRVGNHNALLGNHRNNMLKASTPRQGELRRSGDATVSDSPEVANQPIAHFTATSPVVPTPASTASPGVADPEVDHIRIIFTYLNYTYTRTSIRGEARTDWASLPHTGYRAVLNYAVLWRQSPCPTCSREARPPGSARRPARCWSACISTSHHVPRTTLSAIAHAFDAHATLRYCT
ncbi:hypothetical protein DL762_010180 [Monosporascus cannonballus]|uniref:Uncharacterized protein n=1 Tax=Monosporascus cannonballus TaxID=155416 RepID=A0ABY0GS10_9PEZI|nr:hypothetical protein DL762_010180 [Monosporascus cannonballus]